MELNDLRKEIDAIDEELVSLFAKRMDVSAKIAGVKKEKSLPIFVPAREREKLADVARKAGPELAKDTQVLYSMLFELSRGYQNKLNGSTSSLSNRITQAIESTPQLFPQTPMVACQGVECAFAQIAGQKIFDNPFILYFKNQEGVFSAVEQGLCQYGILPLDNSTAGTPKKVYDLLIEHQFSIIRSCKVNIDHNLLANPGTKQSDIREIYSHQQAINQCSSFLQQFPDVTVIPVANTAIAAELVSKSGRTDVAALSSRSCMELYHLDCIASSVQDRGAEHTRFICFSKNLEIYPGSDRTSLMLILPNRPGSLYKFLARLYVLGINVAKVESRPMPDRELEMMFYFDLETSIYSEEFVQLMCELDDLCEDFRYLGSYREIP